MVDIKGSTSAPVASSSSAPVQVASPANTPAPKSYYDLKREAVMQKLTALIREMQAAPESLSIPQMFETQCLFSQFSQIDAEEKLNDPSRISEIHNQILLHMARQV